MAIKCAHHAILNSSFRKINENGNIGAPFGTWQLLKLCTLLSMFFIVMDFFFFVFGIVWKVVELPFGDRILFLVRRPLTNRGRRMGLGVFRRPRYLAKTPSKTTPADSDANTIYFKLKQKQINKWSTKNKMIQFSLLPFVLLLCVGQHCCLFYSAASLLVS